MITAYIARHFDRAHDVLSELFVAFAEAYLAAKSTRN